MVKVRMNTADVAAEVKCLRRLIGMRCANVYDISPKTYLFKLMNSSGVTESGESEKVLLLMESGNRLHTTAYVRDKSTTPSGFTLKLRKHIRTRRLEDVRQLGYDRIIIFQFGLGANAHYIILELYSQGNLLLTDADFTVLTLLRSHRDDDKGLVIMSRHRYPIEVCRVFERTTSTKLKKALTCPQLPGLEESMKTDGVNSTSKELSRDKKKKVSDLNKKSRDGGRLNKFTLKAMLGDALGYGPALSEHIILDAGLLPSMKIGDENNKNIDDTMFQSLLLAITKFEDWLSDVMSGYKVPEGYILMQIKTPIRKESEVSSEVVQSKFYDEVCPILLNQFKSRELMKLETFDAALDEFYSKIESQKVEQQHRAKEGSAVLKLDKIRSDQENRVHTLKKEVDRCVAMALLIEYNLKDVDAAILAVRVALANGMDWEDLARMVKEERRSGNPVAGLIDKLHLERNCISLLLSNNLDDMDEDELTRPVEKVEVDLSLSAHANARHWYDLKKKQESKQEKTVTAHDKAFKAAERKTRLQLAQEKTVAAITHIRKVHWFEKFNWFITSENYLVISGRDAQQNEMIVKRYMSKGDLYIHADLHGASSTVIKNHTSDQHVPPLTLNQAGCYTVCQSKAWDSKMVTSAWWVYPHQVSKTAPTGEYLTVGSFIIRGKKNFLPPHPLIMGFGILFRLDESSLALHLNERRIRGEDEESHDVEGKDVSLGRNEFASQENFQNIQVNDTNMECTDLSNAYNFKKELNYLSKANNENTTISSQSKSIVLNTNPDGEDSYKLRNSQDTLYPDISVSSISSQLENLIDNALEVGSANVLGKNVSDIPLVSRIDNHDFEENKGVSKDKNFISKAERRKLKKIQDNNNDKKVGIIDKEECTSNGPKKETSNSMKPSAPKMTRGQKGKLKKIKEKYAMQDDEERRIRMALLASSGKSGNNEKELDTKEKELNKDGSGRKAVKQITEQDEASKICYKCKKVGHLSKDCQENTHKSVYLNKHVSDGREILDDDDMVLKKDDSEIDKITIDEDDIHEIGENEKVKLNDVDYLTGCPLPNDILLYAVPVCGPYNALQTYKYRVKITPGTARKGKAAKTAMNLFGHTQEASTREKELMKACTDPELVAAMIGNSKITAPGLTQLKQKQKKGKNQEKKLKNPKPIPP